MLEDGLLVGGYGVLGAILGVGWEPELFALGPGPLDLPEIFLELLGRDWAKLPDVGFDFL